MSQLKKNLYLLFAVAIFGIGLYGLINDVDLSGYSGGKTFILMVIDVVGIFLNTLGVPYHFSVIMFSISSIFAVLYFLSAKSKSGRGG